MPLLMSVVSSSPDPLLQFEQVVYRTEDGQTVLDGASFAVERSEFVVLRGASGAGKTTVLRLLSAAVRPTAGRVSVGGRDISRLKRSLVPTLRRQLGLVEQDPSWIGDLSVADNVILAALLSGVSRQEALDRTARALERVGLSQRGSQRPRQLSGGEQQRAALARAIVRRPAILLVDEPTAHLDATAATELVELLARFVAGGVAVLMATHGDVAGLPANARQLRLNAGTIA
jgi:cell division transport system ATP-binding protein